METIMNVSSLLISIVVFLLSTYANIVSFYVVSKISLDLRKMLLFVFISTISGTLFSHVGQLVCILFFIVVAYSERRNTQSWNLYIFYGFYAVMSVTVFSTVLEDIGRLMLPVSWRSSLLNYLLNICIVLVIQLVVYNLIHPSMEILRKNIELQKKPIFITINIILGSCYILRLLTDSFPKYKIVSPYGQDFLFLFGMILFLVYLSKSSQAYFKKSILASQASQLEQLTEYTDQIESLYQELRGFRHDYMNIMLSLEESIKTRDIKQIEFVYQNVLNQSKIPLKDSKFSLGKLANIKISPIKSIFSNKLIHALEKGIVVEIEVEREVTKSYMDLLDYVRILSILLDNAIEASEKSERPMINIAIIEDYARNEQRIIIENSTAEKVIPIDKIFNRGFSTKGDQRGIGLATVNSILSELSNVRLETTADNCRFKQTLIFKE